MQRRYFSIILLIVSHAASLRAVEAPSTAELDFFEKKIRPVLVEHCYQCHSADAAKQGKLEGGFQLDTRVGIRAGGETGAAIIPGNVAKSPLLRAVQHQGSEMPPGKKLPDNVIADLVKWVELGRLIREGAPVAYKKEIDYAAARKHWAYQPVQVAPVPRTKNVAWAKGDLDRYVLSKIEAAGLEPAPDAQPTAILRRLTFALTGLPPTPTELSEFETAAAADLDQALAATADRLLASPRHGEYWARHWMDGVRFYSLTPTIEIYRDWLIRAFNDGMPYDQFVTWQLAGDLLPPGDDPRGADDKLIATQMLSLNSREMDLIEGCIEVVGQQFLGLSINCAKCHDHKFDAFSQADYYALAGIFSSTDFVGSKNSKIANGLPLKTLEKISHKGCLQDGKVADTNLLIRGEKNQRGPMVERRFPRVLAGDVQTPLAERTKQSGRLELAHWIVEPQNPLTARVMVNRVWMWMTGRPLVGTPNDFGVGGELPANRELLDYLAHRFVKSGWSIKALIREIALARTFRQSTHTTAEFHERDPENRALARMPLRRLDAEQLADAIHFVAGVLEFEHPPLGQKNQGGSGAPKLPNAAKDRLGAYRAVFGVEERFGKMFDMAEAELLTVQREESVTAPQMLFFMNSPTAAQAAALIVKRLPPSGSAEQVTAAYRLLFGRSPQPAEIASGVEMISSTGLPRYCQLLLSASEFMYLR